MVVRRPTLESVDDATSQPATTAVTSTPSARPRPRPPATSGHVTSIRLPPPPRPSTTKRRTAGRPLRRTNEDANHTETVPPTALVADPRMRASRSRPVPAPVTPTDDIERDRPGRGRRRTLPLMTNSERARYYRQKHANETDALAVTTAQLQREVAYLEIRLHIHRQLVKKYVAPLALRRILTFVQQFVETQLPTRRHGLELARHEIQRVELCGDAQAPVVCVLATARGKLTTRVVHNIYPFVLGNTIVLDALLHDEMAFECCSRFFFSIDGTMESERVEIDAIQGLRRPLTDLATVARVLTSGIDVYTEKPPGTAEGTGRRART